LSSYYSTQSETGPVCQSPGLTLKSIDIQSGPLLCSPRKYDPGKPHDKNPMTASENAPRERLASLEMPVYLCYGLYDGIAWPLVLEAMKKRIPRAVSRIGDFLKENG